MRALSKIALVCAILLQIPATSFANHTMNVRVDPLSLLFGAANVGADFAVSDQWTLGGGVSYSSYKSGDTKASAFGVEGRAQFFFNQVFSDSWYLAPYFTYAQGTGESTTVSDVTVSVTQIGAIIGYMWIWENFNIQLGGGFRHISIDADSNASTFDDLSGVIPALEFNLGYAF